MFRDLSCLPAGSSLEAELCERLDRSKHLIVLASPEAAVSRGMEIETQYWFSRPRSGQVLIIVTSGECGTWEEIRTRLLPPAVRDKLRSEPLWVPLQHRRKEIEANLTNHQLRGELIEDLKQVLLRFYPDHDWGQLRGKERSQRRALMWFLSAVGSFILALAVTATGFAWYANVQRRESQRQLDIANQALAAGILADLDLKPKTALTARQRNALWRLAAADEAVRAKFISAVLARVKRLLGSRRVSGRFFDPWACNGRRRVTPRSCSPQRLWRECDDNTTVDAVHALVANLTEAQAQQALAPLLQQIGKTTDPDALRALAKALQALPTKLTEAQAQQALTPLLEQIGKTTDPNALPALAQALQALPTKLTEAQAQQALAPLLQQIGNTTNSADSSRWPRHSRRCRRS